MEGFILVEKGLSPLYVYGKSLEQGFISLQLDYKGLSPLMFKVYLIN